MSRKFLITGLTSAAIVATMGLAYAQSQDESALANSNVNGTQNSLGHDQAGPPAMPADAAAMSATYGSSYDEQGRLAASGDTSSAVSAPAGGDMNTDNSAATSANMGATTSDAANNPYSAPSSSTAPVAGATAPADGIHGQTAVDPAVSSRLSTAGAGTAPDSSGQAWVIAGGQDASAAAGSAGTSSTNGATAETRVDLNSPNERPYNMGSDPVGNNFREGQGSAGSASSWNGSDNSTAPAGEMRAPRADRN
ncbi:hypothetical protein [Ideonella sp.]|uniref:hypothetical protein n=1 Tax=Ideonella sp. TaxID=1929293 RepID=UPI0035B07C96